MKELIGSGVELMVAGMGIVYLFLTMLVAAINIMSALLQRYFPDKSANLTRDPGRVIDKATVAAITSAVHQYRKKH